MNQEPKRQPPVSEGASLVSFTLRDLLLYFVRLGMLGFGGPIALAGHMQRDLVEGRRWVSKQDYLEGLAFSQLSPGPLAAQLAMYLGWLRAGAFGGDTGVHCVHLAFLSDGARIGCSLCSLRQPALDSSHVLRNWGRCHRDHCAKRNQTGPHHRRERLAPLVDFRVDRSDYSVDQV
jgi:hypothetical protein